MIIEDETDINRLLSEILKADGYLPVQAYSGTEGLLLEIPATSLIATGALILAVVLMLRKKEI